VSLIGSPGSRTQQAARVVVHVIVLDDAVAAVLDLDAGTLSNTSLCATWMLSLMPM